MRYRCTDGRNDGQTDRRLCATKNENVKDFNAYKSYDEISTLILTDLGVLATDGLTDRTTDVLTERQNN